MNNPIALSPKNIFQSVNGMSFLVITGIDARQGCDL